MNKIKELDLKLKKGQTVYIGKVKYTVVSSNKKYSQITMDIENNRRGFKLNRQTVYSFENRLVKKKLPNSKK